MEILGLPLNDFIFTIFLPFIFFYLFIYALLRKTGILGGDTQANRLSSVISLTLSALGIFSLYSLGLTVYLPFLAAFTAVAAFLILYLFGTVEYGTKKAISYGSGEAFKTSDEKRYDSLVKECESLWKKFESEKKREQIEQMDPRVKELVPLAQKLGKSLSSYEWFNKYTELAQQLAKGGGG
jgi:predicted membrane channel-forming protein YqfA (hemolysin III family)